MDMASLEVRDKLDTLQLPLEGEKAAAVALQSVRRIRSSATGLTPAGGASRGGEAQLKQLRRFADDDLKKRIEPLTGVAAVKVGGGLEDEYRCLDSYQQQLGAARYRYQRVIHAH
jgi:HAE1 family hydrophobic/amphiphilic exporter-1